MDFTSIVFVQIAIVYCLAMLLPTSRSNSSLKITAIGVLIILSMSWYFMPAVTSKIGIAAWLLLLVVPMSLLQQLESLVDRSQYLAASQLARRLRWLLPTDGMWDYHHLLRGIDSAQQGQTAVARELFARYRSSETTDLGRSATALLYRATDRWQEYIDWVQERLTLDRLYVGRAKPLVYYLRAFAETGDLRRTIAEVSKLDRTRQLNDRFLNLLKMYVLAYCGRTEAVIQSCQNLLSMYPTEVHEFWIATAELAAGNVATSRRELQQLRQTTADGCLWQDIDWRLSQPLPDLEKLTSFDWESVERIETSVLEDARYRTQTPSDASTPVTNLLIAINVLVFGAEIAWRAKTGTQESMFISWGGLFAPAVLSGQWWRILTSNFLHLGFLHLAMNMLGLYYLGKFVEYRLGSLRYFLAYMLAGLGSMATVTYIDTRWLSAQPHITVGASGAIMGMLGTMGAIHLSGWHKAKVAVAGRQFQAVLASVVFQLIFDLTNGHTSIVGHFSGLTIGFLVGLVLVLWGARD